jgi:flagellar protein FliS
MANLRLKQYQSEANKAQVAGADPYTITQMLMAGVIDSLSLAKGAIERQDFEVKGKSISKATNIIEALRTSLDFEAGGEVSQNLYSLYEYMQQRLIDASVEKDTGAIEEVVNLFKPIKEAWDSIPMEARKEAESQRKQSLANAV